MSLVGWGIAMMLPRLSWMGGVWIRLRMKPHRRGTGTHQKSKHVGASSYGSTLCVKWLWSGIMVNNASSMHAASAPFYLSCG